MMNLWTGRGIDSWTGALDYAATDRLLRLGELGRVLTRRAPGAHFRARALAKGGSMPTSPTLDPGALMRLAVFDTHRFDREALEAANARSMATRSSSSSRGSRPRPRRWPRASGVCSFVNDKLDAATLRDAARRGMRLVALRSAGYNHVDLGPPGALGIRWCASPSTRPTRWPSTPWRWCWRSTARSTGPTRACASGTSPWMGWWASTFTARPWASSAPGGSAAVAARIFHGFGCRRAAPSTRRRTPR